MPEQQMIPGKNSRRRDGDGGTKSEAKIIVQRNNAMVIADDPT